MGMGPTGAPSATLKLPNQPGPAPDLLDDEVQKARKAALRTLAARQGMQSTFLTTPKLGGSSLLGGGDGTGGA